MHTSYTIGVVKIRSALYPRDQAKFKCVASNGIPPPAELILDLNVKGMLSLENKFKACVAISPK